MQGEGRRGVHAPEQPPAVARTNKGKSSVDVSASAAVPGGSGDTVEPARKSARMKKILYAAAAAAAEAPAQAKPKKGEKRKSKSSSSSSSEKPRESANTTASTVAPALN